MYIKTCLSLGILLLPLYLQSKVISLEEILSQVNNNHPKVKFALNQATYSSSMATLKQSLNPMNLNASTAMASEDGGESGQEFSFSLSKKILFGTSSSALEDYVSSKKEASRLRYKQSMIELKNNIAYVYHEACLNKQQVNAFKEVVQSFELLQRKRQKAYEFGEISKIDLLLLSIELRTIRQEEKNLISQYEQSLELLYKEAYVLQKELPMCQDLKEISSWEKVNMDEALPIQALQKNMKAAQSLYQRFNSGISPIGLSVGMQQELDTQRITFGLSIPLNFSSGKQEAKRMLALSQTHMLQNRLQVLKKSAKKEGEILGKKLNLAFTNVQNAQETLHLYEQELIPLMAKSYELGESSLIELLLAKREMWKLRETLSKEKRLYYQSLFNYYNLVSSKE